MKATKRLVLTLAATIGMTGAWAQSTEEEVAVTAVSGQTNQWTLKMPAGNVELRTEYYPVVTVTEENKPTAAATPVVVGTDAALVVVSTTAPQDGFVKYLVTETDAAPTSTEQFTTAVPKASDLPVGTAYVWYYFEGYDGESSNTEIMGPLTVDVLTDRYDVAFKTEGRFSIVGGQATVSVDGAPATLDEGGRLSSVQIGQKVSVTAQPGYKLKEVKARKGAGLDYLAPELLNAYMADPKADVKFYYAPGETYREAIANHPKENEGWSLYQSYSMVTIHYQLEKDGLRAYGDLYVGTDFDWKEGAGDCELTVDDVIDPDREYKHNITEGSAY
ncbi:MAG: hypothetical protein IJV06_03725 [Bacteroidaceae bacterium]|nr:hypothetical protein [Bacteroidaceae bacterium]